MNRLCSALLNLLFPPKCVFCRTLLQRDETGLCSACRAALPWTGQGSCARTGSGYALCVSPLWYQGAVRRSIHRYKFSGASHYAGTYGALLAHCIQTNLSGQYDCITWVPLSPGRLRQRGYDQAALLAHAAARQLSSTACATLQKQAETKAQSHIGTDPQARRANVHRAYRVAEGAAVQGRRILLVDDVITTGSTLTECAGTLRAAGAAEVLCATLARAH